MFATFQILGYEDCAKLKSTILISKNTGQIAKFVVSEIIYTYIYTKNFNNIINIIIKSELKYTH